VNALREHNWRAGVVLGAVAVAAFTVSEIRTDGASRNLAEEWAFTGLSLQREGDLRGAEEALRFATTLDPASAFAWDALGLVLQRQGRHEDASRALAQALTVNSSYALAWFHLGLLREETRDFEGAIAAYRQALAIAPQRTDVTLSLGLVLHRLGRFDEADPLLTTAAGRGEGRAHFALALTAIDRRDRTAARRHAAEAARLLPDYAPAQELLRATQ
jgi:tetratricopeptide (TPR) repeat protein